jgi:hypothetical protein
MQRRLMLLNTEVLYVSSQKLQIGSLGITFLIQIIIIKKLLSVFRIRIIIFLISFS